MLSNSLFKTVLSTLSLSVSLFAPTSSAFDANSKDNVVVYYGQGPDQKPLSAYCSEESIDVIVLSFVTAFPEQTGGCPTVNFGNQCNGGTCATLGQDVATCQQAGKIVMLSLGGGVAGYSVTGAQSGEEFGNMLWQMFGPASAGGNCPRPLGDVEVDGFDMDIEYPSSDGQEGYIALITKLRENFASASKPYYISGAPQCIVPDANMGAMIQSVAFDFIWVQFYNTPFCSGATFVQANVNLAIGSTSINLNGFTYSDWADELAKGASSAAKLLIALPASESAANSGNFVTVDQARSLVNAFYCSSSFAGIGMWDATRADQTTTDGNPYYTSMKNLLKEAESSGACGSTESTTEGAVAGVQAKARVNQAPAVAAPTSVTLPTPVKAVVDDVTKDELSTTTNTSTSTDDEECTDDDDKESTTTTYSTTTSSATVTATRMHTVTATGDATGQQPTSSSSYAVEPTTMQTSVIPTPTAGSGSGNGSETGSKTPGSKCSSEGSWYCLADGSTFQRCGSGLWSTVLKMSAGVTCTPGATEYSEGIRLANPKVSRRWTGRYTYARLSR